jgi:AraC-like DNA-binding protein
LTVSTVGLQDCRVWRAAGASGFVEVVEAAPRLRHFPLRVERTFGVCLKFGEPNVAFSDGERLEVPADAILLRPPGCAWSAPPTKAGFIALDFPMCELSEDVRLERMRWIDPGSLPEFVSSVERLHATTCRESQAEIVTELVGILLERELVSSEVACEPGPSTVVRDAREYLRTHLDRNVSLAELAERCGTNRFAPRRFRRSIGMPPHAYQMQLRVQAARDLLAAGVPPSEAAASAGFADQSHFGRRFKRTLGLAPAAYRRAVFRA